MDSKINMKSITRVFCIFLVISLIFTTAFSTGFVMTANAESMVTGSDILKLDEQAPAGLATAKNPYGYPENIAFSLYKGNELMYYGGWNGSTERKMLNGSSVDDLKNYVKAPNKGTSDSSPVPSGTWNWIKAVAFDNDKNSTKEDKVLFVGVEKNQKAYAWVLDYSTKKVSKTLELGNMDWIGYDYDQYSSTSLFQVEAGDFDGDGVDSLLVYAPLNLDDDDDLGCVLYELSYNGTALSKANTANNLLMDQYIADQNKKTHKDHYDADIDCRDKLAVSMQVADYNGDNIDDLAVLSYSHYRYSAANTAYYSPQLKICYGGSSFRNFKNKKANETITLASTSGTTLTFPVAVSLAAGDYNGDGYDDLYAVGVKATATKGDSISSISVDGSKWYMHRLTGNSNSKMTDAGYTFVNSNAWFEDGFYASDYCYGQVMAAGVAISGTAAPEMLFAGGSLYDVSTGVPVRKAHDNYFDSGDEGLGAVLATNTFVQSVAVGNFDNNKAGREQVAFIIGMKEKGHDDYWFESGMISGKDFADTTYEDGSTCYGVATGYDCSDVDSASYIHENKGDDSDEGLNCFYIPMDFDDDGEEAMYLGVNYVYTDPVVNAVLQAAPYFGDVSTAGLNTTSYTLETTYSSDQSESNSLSANLGVAGSGSIPFAETTSFSVCAAGGWCMEFTKSHQKTYSETFAAGGQDIIVVNRIPMLVYRFDVKGDKGWTGKVQMEMSVPEGPVYTLLSIDEYNDFVDEYNEMMKKGGSEYYALSKIDASENWMDGNEGNPYAYNQNGWGNASIEAEKICKGNGYALGKTGGLTTVSFSEGDSTTDSFTAHAGLHLGLSILFGPKAIANYGLDFTGDYAHGWGDAITEGNAKGSSFTVQDLDKDAMIKTGIDEEVIDLYGFTWTCGSWKRNLGNVDGDGKAVKTPFFGYSLTNISSPPIKVNDLKATNVEQNQIELSWTKPATPKGWTSIDGYVLCQGITDDKGNVTYQAYKKIEGADNTSVVVKDLIDGSNIKPDTEYRFVVKSYRKLDNGSAYSDKSNAIKVRTPITKYAVDLNYNKNAVDVTAVQQNCTSIADGDALVAGTVIKVEAKAKEDYTISSMIFTDKASGKKTEIKVAEDGNSATGYYQIVDDTTVDITAKKVIKEAVVTFEDTAYDSANNKVGSVSAKIGNYVIESGAVVSEPITFTATAEEGYVLAEWIVTVDGVVYRYATNDETVKTLGLVGETIDVKAKFELKSAVKETITVTQPAEGGRIAVYDEAGVELVPGEKGKLQVSYDTKVTFKAIPETGYVIDSWKGDAAGQTGEEFVMNVTKDVAVGVAFKAPVKYVVKYVPEDENGNCIVPTPYVKNGGTLAVGTEVKFAASAADGYYIKKWIVTKGKNKVEYAPQADFASKDDMNVTIDAGTTVEVEFVKIDAYTIALETNGSGDVVIVKGNDYVADGGSIYEDEYYVLIAKAKDGWMIADLEGWNLIDNGIYMKKVSKVDGDQSVVVEFIKIDDDEGDEGDDPGDEPGGEGGDSGDIPNEPGEPDGGNQIKPEDNGSSGDKPQAPSTPETGDNAMSTSLLLAMMMASVFAMATGKKIYGKLVKIE